VYESVWEKLLEAITLEPDFPIIATGIILSVKVAYVCGVGVPVVVMHTVSQYMSQSLRSQPGRRDRCTAHNASQVGRPAAAGAP
jgi:hypothetical protein